MTKEEIRIELKVNLKLLKGIHKKSYLQQNKISKVEEYNQLYAENERMENAISLIEVTIDLLK